MQNLEANSKQSEKKDCVFCRIATGEISTYKIYEDGDFLAFLDASPWCEGHTLVIPKNHYQWVWDIVEPGKYFQVVSKIANHYRKIYQTEFVMSFIYGYDIPHAHIHILPNCRGKIAIYPKGGKKQLTPAEGKKLAERLRLG